MVKYDLLLQAIDNSGLRKDYIADKMGISTRSLAFKLNGERPIKLEEVTILCDVLNITSLKEKNNIFFG